MESVVIKANCGHCGKEINLKPYQVRRVKNNFCSRSCFGKSVRGIKRQPFSELHRLRLSLARRKQKPPMLGKIPSLQHRKSLSLSHKGEKSANWKGGISPINERIRKGIEYRLWREAVFARDNWTCQCCNRRGSIYLHAHHIKSFSTHPHLRFAIDNGITLCRECHKLTDNYGWQVYNKRGK